MTETDMEVGSKVLHLIAGKELVVTKDFGGVSVCEYVHEKDYIRSKFMNMPCVTKIAVCFDKNLKLIEPKQLKLFD